MKPRSNPLYQLRISLDGLTPPVWRRILVRKSISLRRLHAIIQRCMGWTDSHMYMFEIDGQQIGRMDPRSGMYLEDDTQWLLREFLYAPGDELSYTYDFDSAWRHTIRLEAILEPAGDTRPRCLDGARACPPENSGGVAGYQDFLAALLDPFNTHHRTASQWIGGRFDSEAFDAAQVNRKLTRAR